MEEDSSSPTRVFCGPITVEEIRYNLASEKLPEMIDRRNTIGDANPSRTIYADSPIMDYLTKKQFFGNANNTDELSDSFISQYLTPNETLHNDKSAAISSIYATPCESLQNSTKDDDISSDLNTSSKNSNTADEAMKPNNYVCATPSKSLVDINVDKENFIDQMSKALNLSSCSSSQYVSAGECSNLNIHKHTDFSKFSLGVFSEDIRDSRYLDRVRDTILVSSDDDDYDIENNSKASEISNDESFFEASYRNMQNHSNSSQIYIISSDTDSSFEEPRQIKTEVNEQLSQLSLHQEEKSLEIIDLEALESSISKNLNSEGALKPCVDDPNDSAINLFCDHNNLNVIEHDRSITPEIVQPSSSLQESSDYGFNDTLEEMEMALKHGLDYRMPDEMSDNFKADIPPSDCFLQLPSRSKIDESCTECSNSKLKSNSEKFRKTLIPVKSSQTKKSMSPMKPQSTKQDFNFKVPCKPVVIRKTPDLKNVLSPVAVYIKNSPKVPQIQHISAKPLIAGPQFPKLLTGSVLNKENEELPYRLYKPAKRTIVSKEKELKLPGSVQKYIPNSPAIIKHQGRVASDKLNSMCIEEKLLNEDLTLCDSDASFSGSSLSLQDVSLLTTKKAYIE